MSCPTCWGEGVVVTCMDDMCNGSDTCIHGDGYDACPDCGGTYDFALDGCDCEGHGCALCLGDEWPENERNREIEEHRAIGKGLVAPLFDLTPIPRPHETGEKVSDDE